MPGKQHMKGVSPKRNRQYEHIKEQLEDSGKGEERSKEEAARTVNKQRREKGETKGSHVTSVELIPGPLISEMGRTAAERILRTHGAIQKGASYAMEQMDGRWVAAVVHEAAPPFGGGGPADAAEESPGPQSEGPDDEEPSEGPPSDGDSGGESDSDGESKPPKEKGGEKGELHQVMQMLQQIGEALGIPLGLGDSPVPGADGPPGAPGASGPPPPPGGPAGPGGPAEQHVIHEKTMKPGEVPPGGTPIGAPAFASVRSDHPWAHIAGKVASWEVSEPIGNTPLHVVAQELDGLSREIGYRYKLREDRDQHGNRVAVALITKH